MRANKVASKSSMVAMLANAFAHRKVAIGLIVLLLLFALKAGTEGLSNFYAQSADIEVARWTKPGQQLNGNESAQVMAYLKTSLSYAPRNPWPLESMGALQLHIMRSQTDPRQAEAAARSAARYFALALAERPTSPFPWANLAMSKLSLGEQDETMLHAIEYAEKAGPWEPDVQQTVIFTGLAVWDKLNAERRAAVIRAMERTASRNPEKILVLAKSYGRLDLFCALPLRDKSALEACAPAGKTEIVRKRN